VSTANEPTVDDALALARRLTLPDQVRLIARLAEGLVQGASFSTPSGAPSFALPVITGGTWPDDLPLSRSQLYDDDERC
jgi:hypothetical protein